MRIFRIYIAIYITFLVAMVVMLLPLPSYFTWFHPQWVILVLIYWIIFSPNLVGVVSGFIVGICLDLLSGELLGSTGLVLAIVAFVTMMLRFRLKRMIFWQQIIVIVFLVGFEQVMHMELQLLVGRFVITTRYLWVNIGTSFIAWPILFSLLQSYQRRFKVL